ncbi:phosphatase PAP2 family protein [Dethiobacter alkaliphilus]|uniref:Phosphoesterase PA-phosphatase related protein n=1 Tax=Dethiobacter alkaliphilus AHT 1 TaxID=555088 RepID=C0GI00_DETAL|nr:phosphatase PAP2 family protein [Dethiobacter alkaliphilus]EEG77074.1 phosphoesterase PA-phosphatase related protein [Dethiobacter alkaliphilus AHT 1]
MNIPPVTRPYFSSDPAKEKAAVILCWAVTLLSTLILILFWEETRSLQFIANLQQYRTPFVEFLFRFFTFLGDDQFFMVFFGVLIWCVSKPLGFWTAFVLLTSGTYSGLIKDMTILERPALAGIIHPDNSAFPSGHTLTAITVWGYLAVRLKNRNFWLWSALTIIMIAVSRLILGYHFLGDVLGGIALGIPFLLFFLWLSTAFIEQKWMDKVSLPLLLSLSLAVPLLISSVLPGSDPPKLMGYLAGASFGYILEKEKVRSAVNAPFFKQIIKSVIGLAVLFGIIMGLGPVLPSAVEILGFIRYGLGGLWVTLIAPALFVKLKLSGTTKEPDQEIDQPTIPLPSESV